MELNHIQPALQQFADHLEQIVLKNRAVRDDFKNRMDHRHLSSRQLSLLEEFASATFAEELRARDPHWWHAFTDYMKKTITILKMDFPDLQQLALTEMIVMTEWTTQSFAKILNVRTNTAVPSFPAKPEEITTIPVLLSYLEYSMLPAMMRELELSMDYSHGKVEALLWHRAEELIRDHIPGFDTLSFAPDEVRTEDSLSLSL
jgi:hypothetical protein